jgi:hypothetical protein
VGRVGPPKGWSRFDGHPLEGSSGVCSDKLLVSRHLGWQAQSVSNTFYSDRAGRVRPRVNEEVTENAWPGLVALIQARIRDGSLARAFPLCDCRDAQDRITGTDEDVFLDSLLAHIPELEGRILQADVPVSTYAALDIIDFVALHIDQPIRRSSHEYFGHEHLSFCTHHDDLFDDELSPGQAKFRDDVDLLFGRNGIAFTLGNDMRVRRLGPAEARPLTSDFRPNSGDRQLDSKLNDAMTRFLSHAPGDRRDALEKLWDAFEQVKYIESGGQTRDVKHSVTRLLDRAVPGPLRIEIEAEFNSLNQIGNSFSIRHHGGQQQTLPSDAAVDYLFIRLASVIALVLRQTGRLT